MLNNMNKNKIDFDDYFVSVIGRICYGYYGLILRN